MDEPPGLSGWLQRAVATPAVRVVPGQSVLDRDMDTVQIVRSRSQPTIVAVTS